MVSPGADRTPVTWRESFGLVRPVPGRWVWLKDAHLLAAIGAALPVWYALGLVAGPQLRQPGAWDGWATLVLLQPAMEELAFRGVAQGGLLRLGATRRVAFVTLANLATSVLFVAWHGGAQPGAWAVATLVPSLVFGHLRERLGSVWPAMIVHMIYNAGFGVTAWWSGTP